MRIPRIYLPLELETGHLVELNERVYQYLIKVLRMKQDSRLILFDGKGNEYYARLEQINKKNALIKIEEPIDIRTESNLTIHLGLAISKGERMDFAIQKAVELGVNEITPLFTEHCVVNLDKTRIEKRLQHWQGIIISASEQCGRNFLPSLNTAITLQNWAESVHQLCLVLDPLANATLSSIKPENNSMGLVIGPEGGLSENEIAQLQQRPNFHLVKFGPRILRTETAAVSVITAMQLLWGDLLIK